MRSEKTITAKPCTLDRRVRERGAFRLQRQYRGLLDDLEAIVCEYDLDRRRFTFVSRRTTEILGYAPECWYENRVFWLRRVPSEQRSEVLRVIRRVSEEGGRYALEHAVLTARGERRHLRNVGRVLIGDGHHILRCVMLDITSMKEAQEALLYRQKLEAISTLAGGIAHDFNNLLTSILGGLSLASDQTASGREVGPLLQEIRQAGEEACRLSNRLLTFARGGQPVPEPCDLLRRLRELERPAGESRVGIRVSAPDDLPRVMADRHQLGQLLHEVLGNAEQAMIDGGEIQIMADVDHVAPGTRLPLEPGCYLAFSVHDSGVGVPQELIPRVFEPYFTTKGEGRGLGLSTAYSIARSHGGHISFQSEAGHGTSVTVWLSAATAESAEDPLERFETAVPGHVLVMDDELRVRRIVSRMLEHLGWQVTTAADGLEAIESYRRAQLGEASYDLVLTDLTVPGGIGGAETMRRLQEIDPAVRAIVFSAYSNDPMMANYQAHGFAGALRKPFTLDELKRILVETMGDTPPATAAARGRCVGAGS